MPKVWGEIPAASLVRATLDTRESPDANRCRYTEVGACWSHSHLFIRFRCEDSDIWGTYTERDDPLYEEEVVEAFLCPTGDLRHYYEFEVSPRNTVFDATVFSPDLHRTTMQVDPAWNCSGLTTSVHLDGVIHSAPPESRITNHESRGWTVDLVIPFTAFPEVNPPQPGDRWRANFYRIDRADPPQFSAWSPTGETPANFHVPLCFGWLLFG